jgi:glutamate dehydrogenase
VLVVDLGARHELTLGAAAAVSSGERPRVLGTGSRKGTDQRWVRSLRATETRQRRRVQEVGMDAEHGAAVREGNGVAEALGRLCDIAALRQPDDPLVVRFLPLYYSELPADDVDDRKLDDVYAVAVAHLALGRRRRRGECVARVVSPDRDRDGWHSAHSVVLVVTDDMPFLVDTMRMVLERRGLGIHLLVHPMLLAKRDEQDHLVDVAPDTAEPADGAVVEAWTQIEIDRVDPTTAAAVEADITAAVADVQHVVEDFPAMRDRMAALGDAGPIVPWLANGQFVFMASAEYDVGADGTLTLRAGSELGLARHDVRAASPQAIASVGPVAIARTDDVSAVFRGDRQTVVAVTVGAVQTRFVGLLATNAYRVSVLDIPGVGDAVADALDLTPARMHAHTGRATRTVLENLPRDLVLELEPSAVARLVSSIVGLQERQLVRAFEVPEPVGRWVTVLVYVPRDRFTADLPERVADAVAHAYGADRRTFGTSVGASSLARIDVSVRSGSPRPAVDLDALERGIDELSTSWEDALRAALVAEYGEARARTLFDTVGVNAPAAYAAAVSPDRAIADIRHVADLLAGSQDLATALGREVDAPPGEWRFRVYRRGAPAPLSELLPLLDHLGLQALDERPYTFRLPSDRVYLYDIGVRVGEDLQLDEARCEALQVAFCELLDGSVESDGYNRLVLLAGASAREVAMLRAYGKYLRQIGFAFSQSYIETALASHPRLVADLVELFHTRFDPLRFDGALSDERTAAADAILERLGAALDAIPSLDDDRICRAFLTLVMATVRTNYYRDRPAIASKFDPRAIPDLPLPRPMHEIWVCGPRVEGVHLRGGGIARGGLRWSDRREDFRTEVLGLMKAQMVKNAVIVPTGAKGGFVVKRPPSDPDGARAEVVECYRAFIRGLLDLTDNVVSSVGPGGERRVVAPPDTVVHDGTDTYLVVAADKGTATFSDIANEIALEYGFWLGDAFASGGSAGYDHKAMGITARGAWESVRRHARVLGKDADRDPLTAVGIGDMSGDVFGNGMLRSRHLRLVAAFDHRHIFIDPDPDPEAAFEERERLFRLPRSSWADYDATVISAGGGVYPRLLKSIELSPQARAALGAPDGPLTPNELISFILRAPVDLLWNGGVGTYVKASGESNAEVGDRANDSVRVNADELRCRMVAEGGNLGLTQRGRIEYALGGGLVNTDAIDNSAGVDCSDHEVNIKILLDGVVAAGDLTTKQRNDLLESMTDDVARLVLANNEAQTLALMIARRQALPMVNAHARYIDTLESEGWLDRGLEFLPTDKQIAERQASGTGLQTPELAVLIAYTKNANAAEVVKSDLPDVDLLEADLLEYFPAALRERYPDAIRRHRLRREIITTRLVNQMVNLSGISFDHRMTEDTGASVVDVTRAWVVAREVLDLADLWAEIDALTGQVSLDTQLELFLDCRRMVERATLWLLRHRRPPIQIPAAIAQFRPGLAALSRQLEPVLAGRMADVVRSIEASRLTAGVPEDLAERATVWPLLHTGFDIVEIADAHGMSVVDVAAVEWGMFARLDLWWLWEGIGQLPRSDRWQTQARSAVRDDMLSALAELTTAVIDSAGGSIDAWLEANERPVARAQAMITEIRRAESFDLTTLSVALRQLRNLALTSVTQ